ncbi:signal transduction histidine kinase [Endobacter medicaginis]|uniref:histidine kinase n=1 Tax=Endobacter medicaginis TaxID=1181271 RepID=A0A839UWH9_9PROT|nr:HAMP domain-containing sensor histidine kinase [Endobacter medicaginis]MBB3172410.1 signal transduction histidine kinase [Endobacter medicaginis]MCX5474100.1 HAMP domain-containing sensor histidine kinase [Endobacter medicaginis]NVN29312.1 HAMP domain-containing histidine kinase [Endobacter medicaginis]
MIGFLRARTSRRRSLQARMLTTHAIAMVVAVALTAAAIDVLLDLRSRLVEHATLQTQAQSIIGGLSDRDGHLVVDYAETSLSRDGHNAFSFIIRDTAGAIRLASADAATQALSALPRTPRANYARLQPASLLLSTLTRPFALDGQRLWVSVAWNLSDPATIFDDILQRFAGYSALVAIGLLTAVLSVDLLVMRATLRPTARLAEDVRLARQDETAFRARLEALPDEIRPLAQAYHDAVAALRLAYDLQRDFTADAAHELRTPLAVLRLRVETLPQTAEQARILADIDVMTRIVAQLLQLSALEQTQFDPGARTNLAEACEQVVATLAPDALRRQQHLGLSILGDAGLTAAIPKDDLFAILRNLVENAIRHTGPGTSIDVVVEPDGTLGVTDDGPGIPPASQPRIFERFWRQDRTSSHGAGLGLAIVQRLVQRHGGTIVLQTDTIKGCRFDVRLPRSDDG